MKLAVTMFLLVVSATYIQCEHKEERDPMVGANTEQKALPTASDRRNHKKAENFVGCWSSLTGEILEIESVSFRASANSYKRVKYREVPELGTSERSVLEFIKPPSGYRFSYAVSLKDSDMFKDDQTIRIESYESLEDAAKSGRDGFSTWVKESPGICPGS